MKINVNKVLADDAKRKLEPVPLPKVRVKGVASRESIVHSQQTIVNSPQLKADPTMDYRLSTQDSTTHDLWTEMAALKKQRAILSTRTGYLVEELYANLKKENPAIAEEFYNGRLPMQELKERYAEIQLLTDNMKVLFDNIQHIEQHGITPHVPEVESTDAKVIAYEIRRLDDMIHKTGKKILNNSRGIKPPKNSARVSDWKLKVSMAEMKRDDLKLKLKRMKYEG